MIETVGVACAPGGNFYGKAIDEGIQYLCFAACHSVGDIDNRCKLLEY
jgi:hypothetical protein